ncbi:hypothetical protein DN051_32310 [Streptomyces cadmiisoli]|uniref:Uncharacterized protein n=2 Tax=Streptomyces cadmiisoli TaxID=2184053 RepID=A0A2Z4J8R1_9ACTN|nr:hypothetical protein DN051_32310 [Streptomyces cadmiisoli]
MDYTFNMGSFGQWRKVDVSTLADGTVVTTSYPNPPYRDVLGVVRVNRFPGLHADTVAEIIRSVDAEYITEEVMWMD